MTQVLRVNDTTPEGQWHNSVRQFFWDCNLWDVLTLSITLIGKGFKNGKSMVLYRTILLSWKSEPVESFLDKLYFSQVYFSKHNFAATISLKLYFLQGLLSDRTREQGVSVRMCLGREKHCNPKQEALQHWRHPSPEWHLVFSSPLWWLSGSWLIKVFNNIKNCHVSS